LKYVFVMGIGLSKEKRLLQKCRQENDLDALKLLNKYNLKANKIDKEGNTPLIWACYYQKSTLASKIIKVNDRNFGQVNHCGNTAFTHACQNSLLDVIQQMLDSRHDCNFGQVNKHGYTALMYACKNRLLDISFRILETGQGKPELINKDNYTALMYACKNGWEEVALKIMATGTYDSDLRKSFPLACSNRLEKVTLKMIDYSTFDFFSPSDKIESFIRMAHKNQLKTTVEKIVTSVTFGGDGNLLTFACRHEMEDFSLYLLRMSIPDEQVDINKNTALIWACINKMEKASLLIIELGQSNVNHIGVYGDTALIHACQNKLNLVAKRLLQIKDINVSVSGRYQNTAFYWACANGPEDIALKIIALDNSVVEHAGCLKNTTLIEACGSRMSNVAMIILRTKCSRLDYQGKRDKSALTWACKNKLNEVALYIISELVASYEFTSVKLAQIDKDGYTPLIWACRNKMTRVAKKIIQFSQINMDHKDNSNNTSLTWTCKNKMSGIATLLLDCGISNVSSKNNYNKSALDYARRNKMTNVITRLESFDPFVVRLLRLENKKMTLYHQTCREHAEQIKKDYMLKKGRQGMMGAGIYFAETPRETEYKAHYKGVMITCDVQLGNVLEMKTNDNSITFDHLLGREYDSVKIVRRTGVEYVVYSSDQVDILDIREM